MIVKCKVCNDEFDSIVDMVKHQLAEHTQRYPKSWYHNRNNTRLETPKQRKSNKEVWEIDELLRGTK